MSEKKTKYYIAEFKEFAVKLAVESDQPVTVTARELHILVRLNTHSGLLEHSEPLIHWPA